MIPHLQLSVRVCFVLQRSHLFQFSPSVKASPSGLTQHLTYNLTSKNQSPSPLESKYRGGAQHCCNKHPTPPSHQGMQVHAQVDLFMGPQSPIRPQGRGKGQSSRLVLATRYLTEEGSPQTHSPQDEPAANRGGGTMAEGRLVFPL